MLILTLNAGSSSIKYKLFDDQKALLSGLIEGIGEKKGRWRHQHDSQERCFADHQQAFEALANQLKQELHGRRIEAVGHRVVHGGDRLWQPTLITEEVLADIRQLSRLAPLHNPVNALGIEYAQRYFPDARHVAIFDSGFHHSMPAHVRQYPIDLETARHYQIQHYGFHGINHEYVAITAARYLNRPLSACNMISLHLGNGASACLIRHGKSCDTSMGMTPLAGLMMGTRCGDIDPAIPLYLLEQGMNASEIDQLLNKNSGLKGVGGDNDMRAILSKAEAGDERAALAVDMYVYAIQKIIGAYLSQLESLDALIFTGGVGENSALIRKRTMQSLQQFDFHLDDALNTQGSQEGCYPISKRGKLILVIRSDEELLMAQKVESLK